jgi:hypothetical protein
MGSGPPLTTTDTDAGGNFEIRALPTGRIGLTAIAADGAIGRATASIREEGERVQAEVTIPSGPHELHGRALWADGQPFRGHVALSVIRDREQVFDQNAVETSAAGRFTIRGLDPGLYRLCAFAADLPFRVRAGHVLIPHASEFEFVVDQGLSVWTGRITAAHDGSPVAGAKIRSNEFDMGDGPWVAVLAESDEEGRFTFRDPPKEITVSVTAPGHLRTLYDKFLKGEEIDIRLDRRGVVTGVVLSAVDGEPQSGVPVHPSSGEVVTDEKGRFRLEPDTAGHIMVYARGNGWISPELAESQSSQPGHGYYASPLLLAVTPGKTTEVSLTVVRAARAEGIVVDADGAPVAGIRIIGSDASPGVAASTQDEQRTTSGPDGRFVFDCLIPGVVYEFSTWKRNSPEGYSEPVLGAPGQTLQVRIEQPESLHRDVLVLDAVSGEPIPGARVGRQWGSFLNLTDPSGQARIEIEERREFELDVTHRDYCPAKRLIDEPASTDRIVMRLVPGVTLSGTVVFPDRRRGEGRFLRNPRNPTGGE